MTGEPCSARDSELTLKADERSVTDIELATDGRIFLFGASREVLGVLLACGLSDPAMLARLQSDFGEISLAGKAGP